LSDFVVNRDGIRVAKGRLTRVTGQGLHTNRFRTGSIEVGFRFWNEYMNMIHPRPFWVIFGEKRRLRVSLAPLYYEILEEVEEGKRVRRKSLAKRPVAQGRRGLVTVQKKGRIVTLKLDGEQMLKAEMTKDVSAARVTIGTQNTQRIVSLDDLTISGRLAPAWLRRAMASGGGTGDSTR
jgi:hypothetical protein